MTIYKLTLNYFNNNITTYADQIAEGITKLLEVYSKEYHRVNKCNPSLEEYEDTVSQIHIEDITLYKIYRGI